MHSQILLTFCWCSFSGGGSDNTAYLFADRGCQEVSYAYHWPWQFSITLLPWPKIVDSPLMLIFMIRQGASRVFVVLSRQPICRLWQSATLHNSDYQWWKANNPWCSVDAHFMMGQGVCRYFFSQPSQPILALCLIQSISRFIDQTNHTYNCWRSVDTYFATVVSATCNHSMWHSVSFTMFWQPF